MPRRQAGGGAAGASSACFWKNMGRHQQQKRRAFIGGENEAKSQKYFSRFLSGIQAARNLSVKERFVEREGESLEVEVEQQLSLSCLYELNV